MAFGEIKGTASALTYVRLEDRRRLNWGPDAVTGYLRTPVNAGDNKLSPWFSVPWYLTKTFMVRAHGMTGTFWINTGLKGTGGDDGVGTYYQSRIGQGSYVLNTFTEAVDYTRAGFRASGAGSLTMAARFQA